MPQVVPVKFPYASRDLWFDPQGLDIVEADYAICSTERGTEIGLVTADPFDVPTEELGGRELKPVLRIATDRDLELADDLAVQGDDAMSEFRRLVKESGLEMKPVGVEYLFGGERAVFYFAAEDRVDFRSLVKELSSTFHIRVDMRQIGVRDETRLAGGYAQCGQELCCARFGGQFEPVSIRMAKEQDLPLNSSKISGVCGRLMCCLRYEFEAYKDFKSRAPKKKTLIDTPLGKARIMEYNTPREQLLLRLEGGKSFRVNLADMTCSEGCKKRAAEQGCCARPDCVTRDVLEKIDSAEMRLALMELDREAGIDVGDGLDSADRIVSESAQRQKRSRISEGAGRSKRAASDDAPESGARRKRRRKGEQTVTPEAETPEQPAQQNESRGGGMKPTRRRRRHVSEGAAEQAEPSRLQAQKKEAPASGNAEGSEGTGGRTPRRRRHTNASSSQQKPATPSVAKQVSDGEVKVTRRRPGDGGGARAQKADSAQQGEAAADTQKRRRRKRNRKPKDGSGGSAQTGAQTE